MREDFQESNFELGLTFCHDVQHSPTYAREEPITLHDSSAFRSTERPDYGNLGAFATCTVISDPADNKSAVAQGQWHFRCFNIFRQHDHRRPLDTSIAMTYWQCIATRSGTEGNQAHSNIHKSTAQNASLFNNRQPSSEPLDTETPLDDDTDFAPRAGSSSKIVLHASPAGDYIRRVR